MRYGTRLVVGLALLAFLVAATPTHAEGEQTLNGTWVWNNGQSGDLEARFTPTAAGKWDVAFHFTFHGEAHVYSGTAEGSLSEGQLAGTVKNEGKSRTFTFAGSFEAGRFRGTHAEVGRGDTGTLTLGG